MLRTLQDPFILLVFSKRPMSKSMHGRSLFYALIKLLERGIKIKNVLEPLSTDIGGVSYRYTRN